MPEFNLTDDARALAGDQIFSAPLAEIVDFRNDDSVRVETLADGFRRLVIARTEPFALLAMAPGVVVAEDVDSVTLRTDFFSLLGVEPPSDFAWFEHWRIAGCLPSRIVYENAAPYSGTEELATFGYEIDQAGVPIAEPNYDTDTMKFVARILVKYDDDRAMHPTEFFSLLFWKREHDPLINSSPPEHPHPLIKKMMSCREDGSDGSPEHDDWIGLRPPLRTYARVEWEGRQTHRYHHDSWQRGREDTPPPFGVLTGVIRNPLVFDGGAGYRLSSKCNLITGDLLFRAGFRSPVRVRNTTNPKPLTFDTGGKLVAACEDESEDRVANVRGGCGRVVVGGVEYDIAKPFARKRYVANTHVAQINREINVLGRALIYARRGFCVRFADSADRLSHPGRRGVRCPGALPSGPDPNNAAAFNAHLATLTDAQQQALRAQWAPLKKNNSTDYEYKIFHIFVLSHFTGFAANKSLRAGSRGIDQHWDGAGEPTERFGVGWTGYADDDERAIMEAIPGGDPTEPWGVIDLNCLERRP